jgi:hypothetical protein
VKIDFQNEVSAGALLGRWGNLAVAPSVIGPPERVPGSVSGGQRPREGVSVCEWLGVLRSGWR